MKATTLQSNYEHFKSACAAAKPEKRADWSWDTRNARKSRTAAPGREERPSLPDPSVASLKLQLAMVKARLDEATRLKYKIADLENRLRDPLAYAAKLGRRTDRR